MLFFFPRSRRPRPISNASTLRARAPPPKAKITTLVSSPNSNKQASRPRAARKMHKTSDNLSAVQINKYERGGAETTPRRQATGDLASIARHASLLVTPWRTRHDYRHASAHYDPTGNTPRLGPPLDSPRPRRARHAREVTGWDGVRQPEQDAPLCV